MLYAVAENRLSFYVVGHDVGRIGHVRSSVYGKTAFDLRVFPFYADQIPRIGRNAMAADFHDAVEIPYEGTVLAAELELLGAYAEKRLFEQDGISCIYLQFDLAVIRKNDIGLVLPKKLAVVFVKVTGYAVDDLRVIVFRQLYLLYCSFRLDRNIPSGDIS